MNNIRRLFIGFAAVLATAVGASAAHADRKMLVLIDASGSMSTVRADLTTRFAAAKARAASKIADQATLGLDAVAVYTFSDTTSTLQTTQIAGGFVDPATAITTVNGLDLFTVGGGNTPLAGAMCDAVDVLTAQGATTSILELASDGEENFTPSTNPCFGPFSAVSTPPYSAGSWQNLVYNKVNDAGVQVQIDLFDPGPIDGFAARLTAMTDPEGALTAQTRAISAFSMMTAAAAADGPPTLADFFTQIAVISGGRLTLIEDTVPGLPVAGDVTGDSCVDRRDALAVARAFGQSGSPQDIPFDLDLDGTVGYADYAFVLTHFTPGGCGVPDPYVARAPVTCGPGRPVVINGAAIESGGITINAFPACQITIKNSLVVSGQNAIKVVGAALVTVDNSILVGQNAVISSRGASLVIAKNSVFHGKRDVDGAFVLIDLGGNTFE
jgi:hypothetical protein